jgi:cytochrome c peroxidase
MSVTKTILLFPFCILLCLAFKIEDTAYKDFYQNSINALIKSQEELLNQLKQTKLDSLGKISLNDGINKARLQLKACDFWLRYLEPNAYKQINGPLPVEWETEVFEKFEKPYKLTGRGFTVLYNELQEADCVKDSLINIHTSSLKTTPLFLKDSVLQKMNDHHHFFLANRLYLLNLAAIYTTGFECNNTSEVITELKSMVNVVKGIYASFNQSYPEYSLSKDYSNLYDKCIEFVKNQPNDFERFDHFEFIRTYINPLFYLNQNFIRDYEINSKSYNDYNLNNQVNSIFNKNLYYAQNIRGIYSRIKNPELLKEIEELGKLLFYDPILSKNNERSCASCHKPTQYYTDTITTAHLNFDKKNKLPRNTPTLLNVTHNHLAMLDGKHFTLQNQAKDVMTNPDEMASDENELLNKVLSCKDYRKRFNNLLKETPQANTVTINHISSALTFYYGKLSQLYSPFDRAINNQNDANKNVIAGFNLFMSKAKCATCHFVPQFNGVKPPYIGSEFEVIGTPADTSFSELSIDKGRFKINPASETQNAFRTTTIRNASKTKPYMHNGVFPDLKSVIDFYNNGGGKGRGLSVVNQTFSEEKLNLSDLEKQQLIAFIESLTKFFPVESPSTKLPSSSIKSLNKRVIHGLY